MKPDTSLQIFIANRIRSIRKQRGFSQEKLSELAGLGSKHIHNIENNKYNFRIQTLSKILSALEVSEAEFFNFTTPFQDPSMENLIQELTYLSSDQKESIVNAITILLTNINKNTR